MAKQKTSRNVTTMRLDAKLLAKLGVIARAEGRSRNNYVEHILRRAVRNSRVEPASPKVKAIAPLFG